MKLLMILFIPMCFALEGLNVGQNAPDINFKILNSSEINFSSSEGKSIVVFYRGSWCPYCVKQLISIQEEVMPKLNAKAKLYAISVDKAEVARRMKSKNNFTFFIISDPQANSLKAFNLINKVSDELVQKYKSAYNIDLEADSGQTHHMIAHPAVFVIEKGKIVFSDVHVDYKQRTENKLILKAIN